MPLLAAEGAGSKTAPREGGQEVGGARTGMGQDAVSEVPARATQGTEARSREWWWAEASIWTERMVSALVNGVTGGRQVVQPGGQGHPPDDPAGRVAESRAEPRGGGRGWPEHRTVRGPGGAVSARAS